MLTSALGSCLRDGRADMITRTQPAHLYRQAAVAVTSELILF